MLINALPELEGLEADLFPSQGRRRNSEERLLFAKTEVERLAIHRSRRRLNELRVRFSLPTVSDWVRMPDLTAAVFRNYYALDAEGKVITAGPNFTVVRRALIGLDPSLEGKLGSYISKLHHFGPYRIAAAIDHIANGEPLTKFVPLVSSTTSSS